MTTWPSDTFWETSKTEGEASSGWFYKVLDAWKELPGGAETVTELTISTGSITPIYAAHTIDTESDSSTDDLANIVITNMPESRRLLLRAADSTRDVVIKHLSGGSGQIHSAYEDDITLDSTNKWVELVLIGTTWYEITRGGFELSSNAGDYIFLPYEPIAQQLLDRKMLQGNGGSVLDVDYPDILDAWGGKIYGNVDSTHFNLPALGGYFPRFFDDGAAVDPDKGSRTNRGDGTTGDNVGTKQVDGFKSHNHSIERNNVGSGGGSAYGYFSQASNISATTSGSTGGNETRPANIYIWGGILY